MNKEELARQYADKKVEERKEYPLCDMRKRKGLTSFDGYAIEQAFEDGFNKAINKAYEWLENLYAPDGSIVPENIRILKDFRKAMEKE